MSLMALGYNWGFFTLLAFTPFPMHLGIHELGYVFAGWGVFVAVFAVFVAPRVQARFGTPRTLYVNLALLAIDLVVIAVFTSSQITLIVAVIVSGAFVGLNNTLTTQAVMLVAPVEKPVASAAYGFVRFIGGGLAPYFAAKLAAAFNVHVPFYLGAATVVAAIAVLATGHSLLTRAEHTPAEELAVPVSASTATAPRDLRPALSSPATAPKAPIERDHRLPIVAAIDGSTRVAAVTGAAVEFARLLDCPVEVLHVVETDIIEELAVDVETIDAAPTVVADAADQLRSAGITASAHLIRVVSDHGGTGRRIAEFAAEHDAQMILIGRPSDSQIAGIFDAAATTQVVRYANCAVHIVPPTHTDEPAQAGHTAL
jgi:nucleotide-binding universal stress UspA family protein